MRTKNRSAALVTRRRPYRPLALPPDLMWELEEFALRDGHMAPRPWIVARLREMIQARADELPKETTNG